MMKTVQKIADFLLSELSYALIVGASSQLTWKIIFKMLGILKKKLVWDLMRYIALIAVLTANARTVAKLFILLDGFVNTQ